MVLAVNKLLFQLISIGNIYLKLTMPQVQLQTEHKHTLQLLQLSDKDYQISSFHIQQDLTHS